MDPTTCGTRGAASCWIQQLGCLRQCQYDVFSKQWLQNGTRIGFGSGIYDRSLPFFSDSKKIGLAFFDQLNKKRLPKEEFDYPLDAVITEKKVFIFDKEDEN